MSVNLQYFNLHFFRLDRNEPELTDESRSVNNWVKISQFSWKKVKLIISCPGHWWGGGGLGSSWDISHQKHHKGR